MKMSASSRTPSAVFRTARHGRARLTTMILELKYRHHLPAIFKRLVEEFALEPQRASKYRLGMTGDSARGLVLPAPPQPTATRACLSRSIPLLDFNAGALGLMFVRLVLALVLGLAIALGLPARARAERRSGIVRRHAGAADDPDRDGHAGHRRQRGARVQPRRRAVDRALPHRRARHAGHGLRDLRGRDRHGRGRKSSRGGASAAWRSSASRRWS